MCSCSLYITTAHFHLGSRYSISQFFTAAKKFHVPKSVSFGQKCRIKTVHKSKIAVRTAR